jgi:flagellin-like protein
MKIKSIRENKKAVSAVIGVILMVAITVAVSTTVYFYVSTLTGETSTKSSTIALTIYTRDESTNETIWLVSGYSGEEIQEGSYDTSLLHENGTVDSGAIISKHEVMEPGYLNSGDTISVTASQDGYYVFLITDTATGSTLFRSTLIKY